jgi:hypothetical protein
MSKDQLLKDALAYLAERTDGKELSEELFPLEKLVNETYIDGGFEEFRTAVRAYVRAGIRSFRYGNRRRGFSEFSEYVKKAGAVEKCRVREAEECQHRDAEEC